MLFRKILLSLFMQIAINVYFCVTYRGNPGAETVAALFLPVFQAGFVVVELVLGADLLLDACTIFLVANDPVFDMPFGVVPYIRVDNEFGGCHAVEPPSISYSDVDGGLSLGIVALG